MSLRRGEDPETKLVESTKTMGKTGCCSMYVELFSFDDRELNKHGEQGLWKASNALRFVHNRLPRSDLLAAVPPLRLHQSHNPCSYLSPPSPASSPVPSLSAISHLGSLHTEQSFLGPFYICNAKLPYQYHDLVGAARWCDLN